MFGPSSRAWLGVVVFEAGNKVTGRILLHRTTPLAGVEKSDPAEGAVEDPNACDPMKLYVAETGSYTHTFNTDATFVPSGRATMSIIRHPPLPAVKTRQEEFGVLPLANTWVTNVIDH